MKNKFALISTFFVIAILWLTGCQDTPTTRPTCTLDAHAQALKDWAQITLEDNGKTFTYTITSRFGIFLDDELYPTKNFTCEPEWVISWVSNYALRGRLYPIGYEAVIPGTCLLKNGDFSVTIEVVMPTPGIYPTRSSPTHSPTAYP